MLIVTRFMLAPDILHRARQTEARQVGKKGVVWAVLGILCSKYPPWVFDKDAGHIFHLYTLTLFPIAISRFFM